MASLNPQTAFVWVSLLHYALVWRGDEPKLEGGKKTRSKEYRVIHQRWLEPENPWRTHTLSVVATYAGAAHISNLESSASNRWRDRALRRWGMHEELQDRVEGISRGGQRVTGREEEESDSLEITQKEEQRVSRTWALIVDSDVHLRVDVHNNEHWEIPVYGSMWLTSTLNSLASVMKTLVTWWIIIPSSHRAVW